MRAFTVSELWLDEALSVNIASLPLGELRGALMRDGSPPLYYFLLHLWMKVFGSGDVAARALSTVFSLAALPLMWVVARRHAGRELAVAALLLLASSPFAIRYGSEARMYALVSLLALLAYLAIRSALDRPTWSRLLAVTLLAAALALTHYWTLYALALAGVILVVKAARGGGRSCALVLGALATGGILFLPWLPTFLYQVTHTGTPWAGIAVPTILVTAFDQWAGGFSGTAPFLALMLLGLVALGLFGRSARDGRVVLGFPPEPRASVFALVTFGTLALAVVGGAITQTGFSERYTAVIFPFFILMAACGVTLLENRRIRTWVLAAVVVLGLIGGGVAVFRHRTQAGEIARTIALGGGAGDVVAYCPDQLGPAVDRLLPPEMHQMVFPAGGTPEFVDWVDYEERNEAADPVAFAHALDEASPGSNVWLVTAPGYKTFGMKCERLAEALGRLRVRTTVVWEKPSYFEGATLIRYDPR
ncbi:MAG: glycosyltransferase family 39 protein [Actinomycetota bacterium]|nr:glycosyltransferase family 39 protein [Actinomycetota bacterium]